MDGTDDISSFQNPRGLLVVELDFLIEKLSEMNCFSGSPGWRLTAKFAHRSSTTLFLISGLDFNPDSFIDELLRSFYISLLLIQPCCFQDSQSRSWGRHGCPINCRTPDGVPLGLPSSRYGLHSALSYGSKALELLTICYGRTGAFCWGCVPNMRKLKLWNVYIFVSGFAC